MFLHFEVWSFRLWLYFCLMKSHVNSGIGNILKFFIHKSSRGIQELVLKYQRWNLKRSFYYFGGFLIQSWVRLRVFLFLSLLTAKQSYPCLLFRESGKFKQRERRELSSTVRRGQKKYKLIQQEETNSVPNRNGCILCPRCNFCLDKSQRE